MVNLNVDQLFSRFLDTLPKGVQQLSEDKQSALNSFMQATLSRMDLVTREEYDIQAEVLSRALKKMHALEEKIKALESDIT